MPKITEILRKNRVSLEQDLTRNGFDKVFELGKVFRNGFGRNTFFNKQAELPTAKILLGKIRKAIGRCVQYGAV